MLTKILLTLTVIVVGMLYVSRRNKAPLRTISKPVESKTQQKKNQKLRQIAYVFLAVMSLSAGGLILEQWFNNYTEVTVVVVNTQSGVRQSYQAKRIDIKRRSFTTTSGKQLFIADVERIEVE